MPDEATRERMKQAALEWLGKAGFDDMHATYAQYYSGAGVINFAATKDDIILYNDLVKVWVDIETNQVIGADARNYLFSHTDEYIVYIDAQTGAEQQIFVIINTENGQLTA